MSDRYRDIDPDGGTRRRQYTIGASVRHNAGGLSLRSEAALRSEQNAARAALGAGCLPLSLDFLPLNVA